MTDKLAYGSEREKIVKREEVTRPNLRERRNRGRASCLHSRLLPTIFRANKNSRLLNFAQVGRMASGVPLALTRHRHWASREDGLWTQSNKGALLSGSLARSETEPLPFCLSVCLCLAGRQFASTSLSWRWQVEANCRRPIARPHQSERADGVEPSEIMLIIMMMTMLMMMRPHCAQL